MPKRVGSGLSQVYALQAKDTHREYRLAAWCIELRLYIVSAAL